MSHTRSRFPKPSLWLALLPCALALYLLLASAQLDLPGLNYDEALDAVPAMQFVLGQPLDAYASFTMLGREWPLTVMPYVGCTTTYLLIPIFALFGPGLLTLRLAMVALGALTLVLAWAVLRSLFDLRVAGIAALLLAGSPAFVFWTRMGAYISLPLVPLALGLVWSLYRWHQGGSAGHLVLAALLAGLGLSTKILFVWLVAPLALGWLLWPPRDARGRRDWLGPLRTTRPLHLLLAVAAGLLGAAPLLAFNLLRSGETLRLLQRNLLETELYGVNNLDLLSNLRTVFATDLVSFLDGGWFADAFGGAARSAWVVPALLVALGILAALARGRRLAHPRRVAWVLILIVAITAQSAVTVSSLGANHLAILWPWPQALIAIAAVGLWDLASARSWARWPLALLAGLLVLLPLGSELGAVRAYHKHLARTGGQGHWSDAIYALAADVDQPDSLPLVALDWGLKRNIQLLTGNRVVPEDGFTYSQQPDEAYRRWAEWRLEQGPALYVEHVAPYVAFGGHRPLLEEAAYRTGRQLLLWREYCQRDGRPVYRVYRVVDAPPLAALPADAVPSNARLGEEIALLGHDALPRNGRPGETLVFHLYWRAERRPAADYKVFVHLAAPDERILAQHDGVPKLWAHPTSAWQAGEIVADRIILSLPEEVAPGRYRLWLGLYRESDGARLPVYMDDVRMPDDRLLLGELEVVP